MYYTLIYNRYNGAILHTICGNSALGLDVKELLSDENEIYVPGSVFIPGRVNWPFSNPRACISCDTPGQHEGCCGFVTFSQENTFNSKDYRVDITAIPPALVLSHSLQVELYDKNTGTAFIFNETWGSVAIDISVYSTIGVRIKTYDSDGDFDSSISGKFVSISCSLGVCPVQAEITNGVSTVDMIVSNQLGSKKKIYVSGYEVSDNTSLFPFKPGSLVYTLYSS